MWTGSYRIGVRRFQRIEREFARSPVNYFDIPSRSSDCISILRVRECCGTAWLKSGMILLHEEASDRIDKSE